MNRDINSLHSAGNVLKFDADKKRARALSNFRRCCTSEHGFGIAAVRTRLSRHIGCLLCSDGYLFLMKSRRKREKEKEKGRRAVSVGFMARLVRTGWSGVPLLDDDTTTSPTVLLRGERLVNNTKRPRQTNIDFGFTGDTRALVGLLPHGKLLHRTSKSAQSSRRLVGMLRTQRDDRQRERGR